MHIPNRLIGGEYWVIRHKPTGKLLCANPTGKGHTRMDVETKRKGAVPRIYHSELSAKLSLGKWLEGCFHFCWEDGMDTFKPKIPRVREDMEIIKISLYELMPAKAPL